MRLPAMKTRFLLHLLNWLDDFYVAGTGRVWCYGWAAHNHDVLAAGQPAHDALGPMLEWIHDNFIAQPVSGVLAAEFSSAVESRDLYLAWEAANPGMVPFSYSPDDTEWGEYPYLVPVARYLVGGEYIDVYDVGPVRLHRIAASPAIGGPFDLFVAYPVSDEIVPVDLSSVLGVPEIGTACPRTGLAPVVASNEVVVPPTGLILVPPEHRLWFPNGDLDLDGQVDLSDLATMLAAYGTCAGDPDFDPVADIIQDGCVNLADLARLLAHYGESCP
jgi:hypothetical protein